MILFLGTLFLNSCLHEFQKLNCYNYVFSHYLQILELNLKCDNLKNKVQIFKKVGEMFLQIFGFFLMHLNIDVVNIRIQYFWLMESIFITKIIFNP